MTVPKQQLHFQVFTPFFEATSSQDEPAQALAWSGEPTTAAAESKQEPAPDPVPITSDLSSPFSTLRDVTSSLSAAISVRNDVSILKTVSSLSGGKDTLPIGRWLLLVQEPQEYLEEDLLYKYIIN